MKICKTEITIADGKAIGHGGESDDVAHRYNCHDTLVAALMRAIAEMQSAHDDGSGEPACDPAEIQFVQAALDAAEGKKV